jgi:DeoR family fructose operon transcriptional repressor
MDADPTRLHAHGRDRQRALLDLIRDQGELPVTTASELLNVSVETIRRDLHTLQEQGLIQRSYGMAHPVETAGYETDLTRRGTQHLPEKHRLAAEAVQHLGEAESLFIDEGYTPQLIAENLPTDRALTVVTASLPVATLLAPRPNINVLILGGRVRANTLATVGHWTSQMLSGFVLDVAFIGANGISLTPGLTTPDPVVAEVKATVMRVARRRVFVGVHDKFNSVSLCRFASVEDLDVIVTDDKLAASEARKYVGLGTRLVRV